MYVLELGGEDDRFARREAASACSAVRPLAAGLATARGVTDRVRTLALTHRASRLVGRTRGEGREGVTVADARTLLDAASIERESLPVVSDREGPLDDGTVAVRANDVRGLTDVSTQQVERELGSVLVERGFAVDLDDPDHELRALFARVAGDDGRRSNDGDDAEPGETVCAIGWLAERTDRGFGERLPSDRPFFQPGSMDPMYARALVNIAGARPGARVLDPMCGTGGVLIEASLVGADVVGSDAQWKMVRGAHENLSAALGGAGESTDGDAGDGVGDPPVDFDVARANATRLPFADDSCDAVVFDAPYGRQSKVVGDLEDLVTEALSEAHRVAPRCVLVADREWDEAAEAAGWTVEDRFRHRVHRSLDRYALVLA
ncbi:methyltransferase domain-containing protein [Halomarina salina]|uniref:tRNA (guanine(10)-N(2))-dimethyltransferase n=1 Tax=Halomarina salina TaxID=1872699 RepID=A0ABD5RMK7_9EURY